MNCVREAAQSIPAKYKLDLYLVSLSRGQSPVWLRLSCYCSVADFYNPNKSNQMGHSF